MTWTSGRVVLGVVAPPAGAGADVDGAGADVDGGPPASCAIAGPAISTAAHNATTVAKAKVGCLMPSPILTASILSRTGEHHAAELSILLFAFPGFWQTRIDSSARPVWQTRRTRRSGKFSRFLFGTDEVAREQLNAQRKD